MGAKRRLAFVLLAVGWGVKLLIGLTGALRSNAINYPDAIRGFPFPYMGDDDFYIKLPAVFVFMNLLLFVAARRLPKWLAGSIVAIEGILLLVILIFTTGGM